MRAVEEKLGRQLDVNWRSFPLEQVNSEDEGWLMWEQSVDDTRSLRAFLAAEAVREQGDAAFQAFHVGLLRAIHERKMPAHDQETIEQTAKQTPSVDVERMLQGMDRPELRERIAQDYRRGVGEYGVFGTPTFLFDGGDAVFVKTSIPPAGDSLPFFEALQRFSEQRPYVRELKKPRPPEATS